MNNDNDDEGKFSAHLEFSGSDNLVNNCICGLSRPEALHGILQVLHHLHGYFGCEDK